MHFNFKNDTGLFAALGSGDLQVGNILYQLSRAEQSAEEKPTIITKAPKLSASEESFELADIKSGTLLTQLAKCCNPHSWG